MLHKHPLERVESLAPLGLTTELSWQRLQYRPLPNSFAVFEERMSARFWEKRNRADAQRPLPAETIIHMMLPAMSQSYRLDSGDFVFEHQPYLTRDLVTLAGVMQWFGTNVGRCFLDEPSRGLTKGYLISSEFTVKLEVENRRRGENGQCDMYTFLTHRCTARCHNTKRFRLAFEGPCVHDPRSVTERDTAVVDGLMRWLGTPLGRTYLAEYRARRDAAREAAAVRRRRAFERRYQKAA